MRLFQIMPQDFLPSDDTGLIHGGVQTQTGTSFDTVTAYTRQVMKVVQADPNVADVQGDEGGDMNISLKPLSQRKLSADQVTNAAAPQAAQHSRHRHHLQQSAHHPHGRAGIALQLSIHLAGPGPAGTATGI